VGLNKVMLIGNLGADTEIRYSSDGSAIANLSVGVSEKWRDKSTGIIKFDGLHRNQQKVKGYAGFDAAWVEEAAKVTKDSWKLLIPTLRKKGSESMGSSKGNWKFDSRSSQQYKRCWFWPTRGVYKAKTFSWH
jgi:phage terminase large subunit